MLIRSLPRSELQDVDCPLCGASEKRSLFTKAAFGYVACVNCAFVFVSPRHPDHAVQNAPMRSVRPEYHAVDDAKMASRRRKYERRLRKLEAHRRTGRLLEIGCREGHFLSVAAEQGWDVLGVEPEAATADLARERFSLSVHPGFLETAGLEDETFDVVYLCEVLEHVDRPVPLFREIRRVLRRGGVVVVKTGNVRSLSRALRGPDWDYFAYDRYGHVSYFSPTTLRRLCGAAQLDVVSIRTWGLEHSLHPLRSTVGRLVGPLGWGGHLEAVARRP